jgi:hypothetical protein
MPSTIDQLANSEEVLYSPTQVASEVERISQFQGFFETPSETKVFITSSFDHFDLRRSFATKIFSLDSLLATLV